MFTVKIHSTDNYDWCYVTKDLIIPTNDDRMRGYGYVLKTLQEAKDIYKYMLLHRKDAFTKIKICKMVPSCPHVEYEVLEYTEV